MKDTRKLSLVYFGISVILLLIFLCGCVNPNMEVDYIHSVNDVEIFYTDDIKSSYDGEYLGIIEVENGEIIYNNIK